MLILLFITIHFLKVTDFIIKGSSLVLLFDAHVHSLVLQITLRHITLHKLMVIIALFYFTFTKNIIEIFSLESV
jgi:hypothetical protein